MNQTGSQLPPLFLFPDDLPTTAWVLLALSLIAALGHFVTARWQPHPGSVIVKGLACGFLVPFVVVALGVEDGWLLGLALLACSAGDVFLALEKKGFFRHGLAAFLFAHLVYIALFFFEALPLTDLGAGRWSAMGLVIAFAIGVGRWIWPDLGTMKTPVALYIATITTMGLAAALSAFPAGLVLTGAMLFVVSDSILAVNRFKMPVIASGFSIWTSYYAAQLLITLGVVGKRLM